MGGSSTGNHSGGSSSAYPPSLYDTSVSSASGGKPSWRNTPTHGSSRHRQQQPQYQQQQQQQQQQQSPNMASPHASHKQQPRQQQQQQQQQHRDYNIPHSMTMDYSDYPRRRDLASMSDPGGTQMEEHHDPYIGRDEYAQSDIGSPSRLYYEPQQRFRNSPRRMQNSWQYQRHQQQQPGKSQSPPSPIRRKPQLPPQHLYHQYHREPTYYSQQRHPQDRQSINREPSFRNSGEESHDEMNASLRSNNDRSIDASISSSTVSNLKNQLWDKDEILQVRSPPSPERMNRRNQPLPSPTMQTPGRHSLHSNSNSNSNSKLTQTGSAPAPNNVPRSARSLSPRRHHHQQQQHQHSPQIIVDQASPQIHVAGSTISDTSYNNRFHSKFYEAAMVARHRGDDVDKARELEEPRAHGHRYQHQQHQQHRSSSARPFDEETLNQQQQQHQQQHHAYEQNRRRSSPIPASPPMPTPNASNRALHPPDTNTNTNTNQRAGEYHRRNSSGMINTKHDYKSRRPPMMPPSPPSIPSPAAARNYEPERRVDRGRSMEASQLQGRSARRVRTPSPLILDRIRSFDNDHNHHQDPDPRASHGHEQGHTKYGAGDQHELSSKKLRDRVDHDDRGMGNKNNHFGTGYYSGGEKIMINDENTRNHSIVDKPTGPPFPNESGNHVGRAHNPRSSRDRATTALAREQIMQVIPQSKNPDNPQDQLLENAADGIGNDRMASLVDKLSAVNRENPESALAQIDSILRQESRSYHTRTVDNARDVERMEDEGIQGHKGHTKESTSNEIGIDVDDEDEDGIYQDEDEDDDDDDDESSDVSSLTNPTFQQGISRLQHSKTIDPTYIPEDDRYNLHSTIQTPNHGSRNIGVNTTSPFTPSTSAFRRPRPSHLQNYSNSTTPSPQTNSMSRSDWKRQQLKKYPPPTTIEVKDEMLNPENIRESPIDFRERMLEKNMQSSFSKKNNEVPGDRDSGTMAQETPKKKLDKFIADKQDLAQKIRSWDELSNQVSPSRSEKQGSIQARKATEKGTGTPLIPPKPSSRRHPWDANMDNVHTKNTSMEGEVGIETEMASRGSPTGAPSRKASENLPKQHFETARSKNRDRNEHNPFEDHDFDTIEKDSRTSSQFPNIPFSVDEGHSNTMPKVDASMAGIPQFHPSKSNVKDSSWVAIPPSSFFPDITDTLEPANMDTRQAKVQPSRNQNYGAKNLSENQTGGMGHDNIEWSLAEANKLNAQTHNGIAGSRSITQALACKTIGNKELKPKEKKSGFLRAFMEKKKKKPTGAGYSASAAVGSVGGLSNSVESRGVKSASHIHSTGSSVSAQNANTHILPPPHGTPATKNEASASNHSRGRAGNRSTSATAARSKSSERFRSSSMAKKFNRVMQLYDNDEM